MKQEPKTIFILWGKTEEEQRNNFKNLFKQRAEKRTKIIAEAIRGIYETR